VSRDLKERSISVGEEEQLRMEGSNPPDGRRESWKCQVRQYPGVEGGGGVGGAGGGGGGLFLGAEGEVVCVGGGGLLFFLTPPAPA